MIVNLDLEIRRVIGLHETLEDHHLMMRPMVVCFGQGRQLVVAICREVEQGNDREREKAFKELLSVVGSLPKADELLMASDAWMATYEASDTVQLRPSERPDHVEVLSFVFAERENPSSLHYRWTPYVRDNDGCPYYLQNESFRSDVSPNVTGDMVPKLLSHIWDLPAPEFDLTEHCRVLRDMGHFAWPCNENEDDLLNLIIKNASWQAS